MSSQEEGRHSYDSGSENVAGIPVHHPSSAGGGRGCRQGLGLLHTDSHVEASTG